MNHLPPGLPFFLPTVACYHVPRLPRMHRSPLAPLHPLAHAPEIKKYLRGRKLEHASGDGSMDSEGERTGWPGLVWVEAQNFGVSEHAKDSARWKANHLPITNKVPVPEPE